MSIASFDEQFVDYTNPIASVEVVIVTDSCWKFC